jgi:inositol hexakisphosphate/diphosphoinositol-pentakisphosphate kinase
VLQVHEDRLELNGVKISKPFVEKPVSAEDHNINIYYADADGGGSKRLFQKEKKQSSAFHLNESAKRTDGAFIYKQFLPTEGTDLKVCREGVRGEHWGRGRSTAVGI